MDLLKYLFVLIICSGLIVWTTSCGGDTASQAKATTDQATTEKTKDDAPKAVNTSNTNSAEEAQPLREAPSASSEEITPSNEEEGSIAKKEEEVKKVEKPKPPKKRAKIYFTEKEYDYGFIMQGDTVLHNFHFKNVGNDDLVITRVETSCGCTAPLYPREPIPPGEKGKISVVFKSAGKLGRQNPSVSVYTNYKRKIDLKLKGFVDAERAKPATPTVEEKVDTAQ